MRPPVCAICDRNLDLSRHDCGLIYFKERQSDLEWDRKMEERGMVGHPPYAEWFCHEHFRKAKELESLTISEAMPKIRAFYRKE